MRTLITFSLLLLAGASYVSSSFSQDFSICIHTDTERRACASAPLFENTLTFQNETELSEASRAELRSLASKIRASLTSAIGNSQDQNSESADEKEIEKKQVEEAICRIKEGVKSELQCFSAKDLGDGGLSYSGVEDVLTCFTDGSFRVSKWGVKADVRLSVPLMRFLALINVNAEAAIGGENTTKVWTCTNTKTGGTYVGSLEDIFQDHKAYLKSLEEKEETK